MRVAPALALVWLRGWRAPLAHGRLSCVDAIPSGQGFLAGTTRGFVHRFPCEGPASTEAIAPGKTILSVASTTHDGTIGAYFYDTATGLHTVRVGQNEMRHATPILAHGPMEETAWCAMAMDGSWSVMDSTTGVITADHRARDGGATCAALHSMTLAVGHINRKVVLYDTDSGHPIETYAVPGPGMPVSIARSRGHRTYAMTSAGGVYRLEPGNVFIPARTRFWKNEPLAEKTSCSGASWCGSGSEAGVSVLGPCHPPIRVRDARIGVMAEGGAVAVVRGPHRIDAYVS